ncbi:MAG: hypothetical protein M5U19_07370 [Microthrixaceae bacterium]|nr:hypothetical protein [Microthrixaceae bacterium]
MPSLNGLGVTFTGLHLNRDGTWGADGVAVATQGLLQTIGLGGIVPFDITSVALDFPDMEDLDAFEVSVTGSIDFAAMGTCRSRRSSASVATRSALPPRRRTTTSASPSPSSR